MIREGDLVSFRYVIKDQGGQLIDSSGDQAVSHVCGAHTLVPGLERALIGRGPGERFAIQVAPAHAYGERIQGDARVTVPRGKLPAEMHLEVGMIAMLEDDAGEPMPVWLVGLTDEAAIFDANHPLAGVTLHVDVEVLEARPATAHEKHRNLMVTAP